MPLPALYYGIIIGEIVYLGGDWLDKHRKKRRAALRKEADKKKARLERQRLRAASESDRPIYEDYESDYEDNREQRYIQHRSHTPDRHHPTPTDRRLDYPRHNYPADRQSYSAHHQIAQAQAQAQPSGTSNTDRNLVLANTPRTRGKAFAVHTMSYQEANKLARNPNVDAATRQAATNHLADMHQWYQSRQYR